MKRKYNIEYADNGMIIRDLDNPDIVQVVEYRQENEPVWEDDKVCLAVGRMILRDGDRGHARERQHDSRGCGVHGRAPCLREKEKLKTKLYEEENDT